MGIVAEFARYKAKLVNQFWAVSALTDTELVTSLWEHRIKVEAGQWVYRDHLSRWTGNGSKLMGERLAVAMAEDRRVRIVKATTDNIPLIACGGNGSKANNTFKARPEWLGKVTAFDGDNFTIVLDKVSP